MSLADMITKMKNLGSEANEVVDTTTLNELVKGINSTSLRKSRESANQIENVQTLQTIEGTRTTEHIANIQSVMQTGKELKQNSLQVNQRQNEEIHKNELKKKFLNHEALRQKQLNQIKNKETFSFYTVKDLIIQGATLYEALDMAGCYINTKYPLTRQGNQFIRLNTIEVDNCCTNVDQNMAYEELITTGNAVVMAVSNIEGSVYSIGLLVYNAAFGIILLKLDRELDSYITNLGKVLRSACNSGVDYNIPRIALSKSFVKVAFTSALCVNILTGIETPEDLEMLAELKKLNPRGYFILTKLIHSDLGIQGRWL